MASIGTVTLKSFVESLAILLPDARFEVMHDGIAVLAVDTANVAMVNAFLPFRGGKTCTVGVDIAMLKTALSFVSEDNVDLSFTKDKVILQTSESTHEMRLLNEADIRKKPNPPAMDFEGKLEVPGSVFHEAIKAAAAINDVVELVLEGEKFSVVSEGDLQSRTTVCVNPLKNSEDGDTFSGKYSLEYLKKIARFMAPCKTFGISLENDNPVRFDFIRDEVRIAYLVAPRIEGD